MIIFGIGGSAHDFSSCIVQDGQIRIMVEEERITRDKHAVSLRSQFFRSKAYVMDYMKLNENDIDMFIGNDILRNHLIKLHFPEKTKLIGHHMSHIAGTYYTSGFPESALLCIDGGGSALKDNTVEVVSYGYAQNNDIQIIHKTTQDQSRGVYNSLGGLYEVFTTVCGFRVLEDGKTMGLSAYGKDTYYHELSKNVIIDSLGNVSMLKSANQLREYANELKKGKNEEQIFQINADLAYAGQRILEESVFQIMRILYEKTKSPRLCYSGGVALNSVLNGKIFKNTPFKEVYILPACNDAGTSIGAALYGYYNLAGYPYHGGKRLRSAYLGKIYDDYQIEKALDSQKDKIQWRKLETEELLNDAVRNLSDQKIIGWFQGRSEIGPRALGHRSILTDARDKDMKEKLNKRVKFRESFRPFAPVVPLEKAKDYFYMDRDESEFMLFVSRVRKECLEEIPSVMHIDQTARVQTLTEKENDLIYQLVMEFGKLTGTYVLLNTSFNVQGQPIVEKPKEAIDCFLSTQIDLLYMNRYKIEKVKTNE